MSKLSPMYRQYKKIKTAHPGALLFYRLGDFYELFEEDAEIGARELGLTLTKRKFSKELQLPMAGVPHRHVNGYISRLIKKGYMVAVADQLEDARQAKGLVERDVVRVVTSGTVMDQPMLRDDFNNFLVALVPSGREVGLAFVDISTGEFGCAGLDQAELLEEIARILPSEIILPPAQKHDAAFCQALTQLGAARLTTLEADAFRPEAAQSRLREHFQVASLEGYSDSDLALTAAGVVLTYLNTNQLSDLAHLTDLATYHLPNFMALDSITRRNLELTRTIRDGNTKGTLLATLDQTQTRMGARLLRRVINQPLGDLAPIQARLDAVEALVNDAFLRQDLRAALHGMYDLERVAGRIGYGNANGRDLVNLKATLERVPDIKRLLAALGETGTALLLQLHNQLDPLTDIVASIGQGLVDEPPILLTEGGLIKTDYHPDLARLRADAETSRAWLADYEAAERERTGIKNLRIRFNQVFGFFIEVTRSNLNRVPDDYQRRATVTNAERFVTAELKSHETKILTAEETANNLEYDLFLQIRQQVAGQLPGLRQTAQALAHLDVLASLAEVAAQQGYTKPVLTTEPLLSLHGARHPVVEQVLPGETPFVPNDCYLDEDRRLIVLTGPNMSGKSVYLRQVALAVLMAHMGSFVAAAEARIGLTDRIFARAGASDDISQGRSTFLVEMSETAHILHHATARSLIILDEVGRGTSTYDGLSLAWAVAEDIYQTIEARCLFATHFHELTRLGDSLPGAANYCLAVHEQDGQVIFLRRLVPGGADRSYGIHVARLAGLPPRILERAGTLLASLQQEHRRPDPSPLEADRSAPVELEPAHQLSEPHATYEIQTQPNGDSLLLPVDEPQLWSIIGELYRLDIANLTPIEALMRLNRWQKTLKQRN